ncbi:MAG TPA: hypothetical protein VFO10_00050 [Oligoflexus sp.]|uniref:hypothetical protein n=1 Tax=Oligoflexus sp. TaxID=1971216 RepID=UPI002D7F2212|nr:hypothetical protein [Oligoflexus sp.]HET9235605.1 hypothetical protein [Oligoflexus sp.]
MRLCVSIPLCATLLLNACHPIVVRVGQRTQGMEAETQLPSAASIDMEQIKSWNTIEDFLQHLDDIKKLGRDALLKRYHQDGRQDLRQVFRRFREAVSDEAAREGARPLPYLSELEAGACVPLKTQDIFGLDAYGDLKALLETTFLSRIQPSATLPEPGVPGGMDTITKLGFFELGIAMDGDAFYEETPLETRQGADIRWKVIHEQGEPEEWSDQDARGVQFRFLRREVGLGTNFTLSARVGLDVYEKKAADALPALWIDFEKTLTDEGASTQIILMQTGWQTAEGRWQELRLSRRLVIAQDLAQGHILHVTVSENWQKPDVFSKKFRMDLEARRLCSELGDL